LKKARIEVSTSEITMLPQTYVKLEGKDAQQMLRLVEGLEDHEDVQHVYSNFDIDQNELEQVSQG